MARPLMLVVAGPSGVGKTTCFPITAFGIDAFSVDDRGAQIVGSYQAIPPEVRSAVAAECEAFIRDHLDRKQPFAVETTLRTTAAIEQAELARKRGFSTHLRFIATDSVAENVTRVLQRAQGGGHAIPEREIREIHRASIGNLQSALAVFERVRVYDSTARWAPPRLVATARDGRLTLQAGPPGWLEQAMAAGH